MADVFQISRPSEVPIRRQISGCAEAAISDGRLPAGARLPSVRSLARRLRVHPNTVAAAYQDLQRRRLVRGVARSGVWVRRPGLGDPGVPSESGFRRFLASQRAGGRSVAEVSGGLRRWARAVDRRRILFVEEEAGLRTLAIAELGSALRGFGVDGCGLLEALRRPAAIDGAIVIARPGPAARLERVVSPWIELLPVGAGIGPATRERILALPTPSVVGVISNSAWVRERVRHLAASRPGGGVGCLPASSDRPEALDRVLRIADLLLFDPGVRANGRLSGSSGFRRRGQVRLALRLLDPDAVAGIARYLGARRPRAGSGRLAGSPLPG